MTDKSLKKLSSSKKKQRKNAVNEHEPERFAPCAFALEKFLKEHRKKLSLQTLERTKSD
ncbi:hypothetical protein PCS78_15220 [Escherichia coli]|uniref:hypothetical protein n=1 Tax=Escherichia coli TaxID=562 RepID=UPI001F40F1A8|nr:hypothetical protein [Escherichia coli]MDM4818077.1 hypothetical protein [Escherichia coli]MDM4844973.1 hypothetical protein [Escherichia coli]WHF96075.1 hypothetical protein QDX09_16810 [Escherichia coli]WMO52147.1 hypothetical protein PCS78_15220 [Escherichia coli]